MAGIVADPSTVTVDLYRHPTAHTALTPEQAALLDAITDDPARLCRAAQGLLVLPPPATTAELSPRRLAERNTRAASDIVRAALDRDDRPLSDPRPPEHKVTGTCRHFAVLSCAFLRSEGIAARARCGFATYFQPGLALDHWITEYWSETERRWIRIDSEILDLEVVPQAEDLVPGQFLDGAQAWLRMRDGADASTFGVDGTDNWGPAEIIGNAIRDLACLNGVEMLPWDEWGPMAACYSGDITPEIEHLMDDFLAVLEADDEAAVNRLYRRVPVPDDLLV